MKATYAYATCWITPERQWRWLQDWGELDTDCQLNLSLVRLLEIVSEAAGRVPAEERVRYPDLPWPEIVSLRNRLIHGYDSVDFDILWRIVSDDLPPLIAALEKALE
jgi:uncharacterized protein with HEPN domain